MKKQILSVVLALVLVVVMIPVNVRAASDSSNVYDEDTVSNYISQFFYYYEDVDGNYDNSEIMKKIAALSSSSNQEIVNLSLDEETYQDDKSYLNTVSYMMDRRTLITNETEADIREYNKTLDVSIKNISVENGKAKEIYLRGQRYGRQKRK